MRTGIVRIISRDWFQDLVLGFLDLLFPPVCVVCNRSLNSGRDLLCPLCGEEVVPRPYLFQQEEITIGDNLDGVLVFFDFNPVIQQLIHRLKYNGMTAVGRFLSLRVVSHLRAMLNLDGTIVTVVPLHPIKLRERGYNQSEVIGEVLAERLVLPFYPNLLKRSRYTSSQTKLNLDERRENVKAAFMVQGGEKVSGKTVLIVDDVFTTGSTLNSCAEVLKQSGAGKVLGLALAHPGLDDV